MGLSFLVTGGYLDGSGEGSVWHVDLARERAEPFLHWVPPAHLHVPRKGFAGGCRASDGDLYVTAHCAVVRIDVSRAVVSGVLHQPSFNDLHHVAVSEGRLYIVNTGLGTIDIHDLTGRFIGSHALLPAWVNHLRMSGEDPSLWSEVLDIGWDGAEPESWPQRQDDKDGYHDLGRNRRGAPFARLKVPDYLHPNHVCVTPKQTLVTCLYDGTVRDLRTFETVLALEAHPHDGFLAADTFWTTSIDGLVRVAPLREGRVGGMAEPRLRVFDTGHAGWCRGLWTNGRLLAVGLTEVRRGYMPRHRWADREPEGTETSILLFDLSDGHLLSRIDLTDRERHSKIYSILPMGETE